MVELIEEIDWHGNVLKLRPKTDLKQAQFPHKGALVIPRTAGGKIILARRAADKHPFPNVWVCAAGGHVSAGETFEETAEREMLEEIGIRVPVSFVSATKHDTPQERVLLHTFTTQQELDVDSFTLDLTEVQYCKAFTIEEVLRMIETTPHDFAPTFRTIFQDFARVWKP